MTGASEGSTKSSSGEIRDRTCDLWFTRHSAYSLHRGVSKTYYMSTNLQAGRHLYLRLSIGFIYLIKFVNFTFDLLDLVCLEESIQLALIILFLSNYIVRTCLFYLSNLVVSF